MKKGMKYSLIGVILGLFFLTSVDTYAKPDFVKTYSKSGFWGHITLKLTLRDTNGDGCYDYYIIDAEWDLPWPIGSGRWHDEGRFGVMKLPDGTYYQNTDPNKDPCLQDSIELVDYQIVDDNIISFKINFIDMASNIVFAAFEKSAIDSIPIYSFFGRPENIVMEAEEIEVEVEPPIKVFPNPAADFVILRTRGTVKDFSSLKLYNIPTLWEAIRVTDSNGNVVLEWENVPFENEIRFDTQKLPSGQYFISAKWYGNYKYVEKITVVH